MKILNKRLSLEEFKNYVNKKDFGSLPPTFLVLHHTWKPTKAEWNGEATIQGLKNYYESKGWSAGPHLFIADDGIWLFTDMYDVGIHAGVGNGTLKTGYSIGIEVVGNYDNQLWSGETKKNTLGAIKALQGKLNISDDKIKFHRDYSSKTCPGKAITKEWVINQLNKEMSNEYEKNLYKIYEAVEKLLERNDGDNPNDGETKEIIDGLSKFKKEVIEKDSEETLAALAKAKQEKEALSSRLNNIKTKISEFFGF